MRRLMSRSKFAYIILFHLQSNILIQLRPDAFLCRGSLLYNTITVSPQGCHIFSNYDTSTPTVYQCTLELKQKAFSEAIVILTVHPWTVAALGSN